MLSRWRYKLSPIPAVASVFAFALFVGLGIWQTHRAERKEAIQQRLETLRREPPIDLGRAPVDAEGIEFRGVSVRGEWRPGLAIFLDNRTHHGVPGYHVVMPLRVEGGGIHALVNRGWVAAPRLRSEMPDVKTPGGIVEVAGLATVPQRSPFELGGSRETGRIWQNLVMDRYRTWSRLELHPVLVLQTNDAGDGLVRDWRMPSAGAERHRGYAFQWFALAGLVAVLLIILGMKRT